MLNPYRVVPLVSRACTIAVSRLVIEPVSLRRMVFVMRRTVLLLISGILAIAPLSGAIAGYGTPNGSVTVTTSDPSPNAGDDVVIPIAVLDASGSPDAGVACTATVSSQPGAGATVSPTNVTTGADGSASVTLKTGSSDGAITVSVECDGDRDANVTLAVGSPPAPPDTGTGASATSAPGGLSALWLLVLLPALGIPAAIAVGRRS